MSGDLPSEPETDTFSDEEFMEKVLNINPNDILYNKDTLLLFRPLGTDESRINFLIRMHEQNRDPAVPRLKGMDLKSVGVKHYQFSELSRYIHDINFIARLQNGYLYRGVVDCDGRKSVTIKVWNLDSFPIPDTLRFYPARLYNDIYLLKKKLNSESYLPKLIGYSIDKMFAVVYDIPAKYCLGSALVDAKFSWKDRILAALGVARAFQTFHDQNIKVGRIDPRLVIYDKDTNLYLCDFGLCPDVKDKINDELVMWCLFDSDVLKHGAPELSTKEEWLLVTDIYVYGLFLLELISKVRPGAYDFLPTWAKEKFESCKSLVHDSFDSVDEATKFQISKLVIDCTELDMYKRPKIASVIDTLERIQITDYSSPLTKKQKFV